MTEENYGKQVTDSHLEEISCCCCGQWRSIPSYLDMESLVVQDIDRAYKGEEEKRKEFLLVWKKKKGSYATYRKLIHALLKIDCRNDAEKVYKLLQKSVSKQQLISGESLGSKPTQPASDSPGIIITLLKCVLS